jgi:hypothetical protein
VQRLLAALAAPLLFVAACSDSGGDDAADDAEVDAEQTFESPTVSLGDADEGIDGVQAYRLTYTSPPHRPGEIDYGMRPPAGGLHNGNAYRCGFYDAPLLDEVVVHDLEHGVVWLSYAPELPQADLDAIHDLARENEKVIAAPYEGLDPGVAVVATAWARQLTLDSVDDPRLAEFIERYEDGDQVPEQGVGCSVGAGEPIP